jgi:hypothetical protein
VCHSPLSKVFVEGVEDVVVLSVALALEEMTVDAVTEEEGENGLVLLGDADCMLRGVAVVV